MGLRPRPTAIVPLIASAVSVLLAILIWTAGETPNDSNHLNFIYMNLTAAYAGNLYLVQPTEPQNVTSAPILNMTELAGLPSAFADVAGELVQSLGPEIDEAQRPIINDMIAGLEVNDFYVYYLARICSATLKDPSDRTSPLHIIKCFSYNDQHEGLRGAGHLIPTAIVIGGTEFYVPLMEECRQLFTKVLDTMQFIATMHVGLLAAGCITQAITILGSCLGIFLGQSGPLVTFNAAISTFACVVNLSFAGLLTIVVILLGFAFEYFGSTFAIHWSTGTKGIVGAAWGLMILSIVACVYWVTIWYVEFKRFDFSRRSRSSEEVGNYKGIMKEILTNLKVDGYFGVRERIAVSDSSDGSSPVTIYQVEAAGKKS